MVNWFVYVEADVSGCAWVMGKERPECGLRVKYWPVQHSSWYRVWQRTRKLL